MWTERRFRIVRRAGVTLVELIVAIVIIATAMAALAMALSRSTRVSADPLILQQKIAIAEGLMGEILLKPWDTGAVAKTAGNRDNFVRVGDFQSYGLDAAGQPVYGIVDADGGAVTGLETYAASVNIDTSTTLTSMPANTVMRIVVTVRYRGEPANEAFVLTGWRTKPL